MLTAKLSRALLVMGAAVGLVGIAVFALDLRINIPDWMIRIAMIKLTVVASLGLLGAGALVGRHVKRQASLRSGDQYEVLGAERPDRDLVSNKREFASQPERNRESP